MAATTLPGYFKRVSTGSAAMYAFSGWLPIHHRKGIGRCVWLLFAAPATDITTALEGASFVMQRPAGQWERIPAELGENFCAKLQALVRRKWTEASTSLN